MRRYYKDFWYIKILRSVDQSMRKTNRKTASIIVFLCLLLFVTGMTVFHINSDEQDDFTYDKSTDTTMFRCSDHDPVIVGLNLNHSSTDLYINTAEVLTHRANMEIHNANGGYVKIYDINGRLCWDETITNTTHTIETNHYRAGLYIVHIYYNGKIMQYKIIIN